MAINLTKGQKIDLTKTNSGLNKIMAGLGWDTNKYSGNSSFDLDVSIFLLDANDKATSERDLVFYNNKKDAYGAVEHLGDNLTGEGEGDDEQVLITLDKIPDQISKVVFTVTIHEADERRQNFGQVSNSFIRIVDTETNTELLRFDLGEEFSIETSIVIGELYRYNGEWKFNAVGGGFHGGLAALCSNYGL